MCKTNDIPLTEEQSAFAGEHESLIGKYLGIRRLPKDEYYDVVVFGYLRAVRNYLTVPRLQTYRFTTIAFRAMSCELFNHFRAQRAAMRYATVLEYNEDRHTDSLEDPVAMLVERAEDLAETRRQLSYCLSTRQNKIIHLKVSGYSVREAAKAHGVRLKDVTAELEAARDNVIRFAPELMERAA